MSVEAVETNAMVASDGTRYLSPDIQRLQSESAAATLVPGDTNGIIDVFVRDRVAGTTSVTEGTPE